MPRAIPWPSPLALLLATGLSAGCNQYELFRVAGFSQTSFNNDADVLFVVDNSSSMQDESQALAVNFDAFIRKLTDPGEGAATRDGLVDAVENYISYAQNREIIVDYQLGITTTDVAGTYGALYGGGSDAVKVIADEHSQDIPTAFNKNLLCSATCFVDDSLLADDPAYECTDPPAPPGDAVSTQYLDCLCGAGTWEGQCGAGTEEHLEAVFMAMCRAAPDGQVPDACFTENQFSEADVESNAPLLRDGSTFIPILVTDEGDTSRRMSQGDAEPDEYDQLFAQFEHRMTWAVIGPNTEVCNGGGATTWGVSRLRWFVDDTNGRWFEIAEETGGGDCQVSDFASAMEQLGELLNSLLKAFVLQSVPDVDTIVVFVNGDEVPESVETTDDETGTVTYTDGWSYLPAENAVEFHGSYVPDYNAEVEIFYRPLSGMPRELPF